MREITNKELIHRLLKIPTERIRGQSMYEIVNLLPNKDSTLVGEICCRYGEKRKNNGEQFKNAGEIYQHFKIRLGNHVQEAFMAVYLDNKHRIISEELITQGILNQSLVHPREVFAQAIQLRSAAIILIHNHPSGDSNPSPQDIEITKRLCDVGTLIGIKVLDHVIIGSDYYSFVENQQIAG